MLQTKVSSLEQATATQSRNSRREYASTAMSNISASQIFSNFHAPFYLQVQGKFTLPIITSLSFKMGILHYSNLDASKYLTKRGGREKQHHSQGPGKMYSTPVRALSNFTWCNFQATRTKTKKRKVSVLGGECNTRYQYSHHAAFMHFLVWQKFKEGDWQP
jgi:hypothetical protein